MASRKDRARTRIVTHFADIQTRLKRIQADAGTAELTLDDVKLLEVAMTTDIAATIDGIRPPAARSPFRFAAPD